MVLKLLRCLAQSLVFICSAVYAVVKNISLHAASLTWLPPALKDKIIRLLEKRGTLTDTILTLVSICTCKLCLTSVDCDKCRTEQNCVFVYRFCMEPFEV
jgi:hypothetical protein